MLSYVDTQEPGTRLLLTNMWCHCVMVVNSLAYTKSLIMCTTYHNYHMYACILHKTNLSSTPVANSWLYSQATHCPISLLTLLIPQSFMLLGNSQQEFLGAPVHQLLWYSHGIIIQCGIHFPVCHCKKKWVVLAHFGSVSYPFPL